MNTVDAYHFLAVEMAAYRELSWVDLVELIGPSAPYRLRGTDSTEYAIEIKVRWRTFNGGDIRVIGWIARDDCGPMDRLDDEFIVTRDPDELRKENVAPIAENIQNNCVVNSVYRVVRTKDDAFS